MPAHKSSSAWEQCWWKSLPLQWRHNERDGVSNHQPHDCFYNGLFRHRSKKTSKLRVTGLCVGKLPGTSEFPAQMTSNAEDVSIWWRHHDQTYLFPKTNDLRCMFRQCSLCFTRITYLKYRPTYFLEFAYRLGNVLVCPWFFLIE